MAVDPVIQKLMDLIEPPDNGAQARPMSDFGAARSVGTSPHVGFDENRGRGVQPHGRVTSPVYGRIKNIDPKLGRIVIEERDPVTGKFNGYDVEILHTQTQTVKPGDEVEPTNQIGTQGDVGAPNAFHAHIQVFHGDRTPLNPLRHLFEYHHPGEQIPALPQFEPRQVPPRAQPGSASQSDNQGRSAPGMAIPDAEGPTSLGGPGGPKPLLPLSGLRRVSPSLAPAADPTLPPLHFAPQERSNLGPFAVPGLFRSGVFDGVGAASATSPPAMPGSVGQIGDGNGIGDWWNGLAPAASSNNAPPPVRRVSSRFPDILAVDPSQPSQEAAAPIGTAGETPSLPPVRFPLEALLAPDRSRALYEWASSTPRRAGTPTAASVFDKGTAPIPYAPAPSQNTPGGLPGLIAAVAGIDPSNPDQPPAGGLLALLQEYLRNNPDGDSIS